VATAAPAAAMNGIHRIGSALDQASSSASPESPSSPGRSSR
jgi:hypothetical protein